MLLVIDDYIYTGENEMREAIFDENIVLIPLTQGYFAIVDRATYERIPELNGNWHVSKNRSSIKARRTINGKNVLMHRLIMNCPDGMVVDHINHNSLDNRECNLRVCTNQQNLWNSVKHCDAMTSKYKGVHYHKQSNRWRSQIRTPDGQIYKDHSTELEAARDYDQKALKYFGEFAYVNFPLGVPADPLVPSDNSRKLSYKGGSPELYFS
jgi:hypothetical protein